MGDLGGHYGAGLVVDLVRRPAGMLLAQQGALLLGLNGLRAADRFAQRLHAWRLQRGRSAAQAVIGRYAALKATGVANDATQVAIGYLHSLSKRTTLYSGWQHVTNDDSVAVRPATITNGSGAADLGGSGNLIVGGINHAF